VHGLNRTMEEQQLIAPPPPDTKADVVASTATAKRFCSAVAGLKSNQLLRSALGHLSLFGALVLYTAAGGLVRKRFILSLQILKVLFL